MRLAGANFQLGHWPALTKLILGGFEAGDFPLRHWPPLKAEPLCLRELRICAVQSNALGLLQLEHTILSLLLGTSASWHREIDSFYETESPRGGWTLLAKRCNNPT